MPDNLDSLRHIEGFPIGADEDILALSDPPHYTAYPNPHIGEFIAQWGKPYDETTDTYHREPYVADVSEGKNDPIYNAHSYHTKVPYKAIIPFIEHYTEPGDIVFDGFCGTGMTGVAAQMVGRRAILCDLSPAATFIAYNYNTPVDVATFEGEANRILEEVERECGWMYETRHSDGRIGRINYTVWSDVFRCPYCGNRIVFWDVAVDSENEEVLSNFSCPSCQAKLTKRELERVSERKFQRALNAEVVQTHQVPVLIKYTVDGQRYEKRPETADLAQLHRIDDLEIPHWFPATRIDRDIDLWYERDYRQLGIYSIDAFYTKRALWTLAAFRYRACEVLDPRCRLYLLWVLTSVAEGSSKMNRERPGGMPSKLSGTLYVGALIREIDPIGFMKRKVSRFVNLFDRRCNATTITTQSAGDLSQHPDNSIDYIFTDPPFGSNIIYSDLSIFWESWLNVFTEVAYETVVHRRKKENPVTLDGYRRMMTQSFSEMYRVLKPGRWITVVFHNSKASVWNAIQDALARAGFLVAQVTVLDKQQGSFKQVTTAGAVKNDLIINAYKPRRSFEIQLIASAGVGQERAFIGQHLDMLPATINVERTREMLYSKLLAYYVQHGYQIQYNADQFYRLLDREFVESDGYYFRDEAQRGEYETTKLRLKSKELAQAPIFVLDERSALQWLWHFLDRPRSYSDIYTEYVKVLQVREDEIPELRTLLDDNFVHNNGDYRRPDVATKQELEQKRQTRLLREFDDYLAQARAGRKLKDVRKEAVIAGFTQAYRDQRYADILTVGRKLDKRLVEASTEIFDFMDIAEAKLAA